MQIVINISEELYKHIQNDKVYYLEDGEDLYDIVKGGTPLPKGHGKLIDVSGLMPDSDYDDGIFYAVSIGQINGAPTIIEADKENEDGNVH